MGEALDLKGAVEAFRNLTAEPATTPETKSEDKPEPADIPEEGEPAEVEGSPQGDDSEPAEDTEDSTTTEAEQQEQVKSLSELAEHLDVDPEYLLGLEVEAKIDGEIRKVPLKDALSSYQTITAAEKRLDEAKQTRKAFEAEKQAQLDTLASAKAIADRILESQWSQLADQEKALASLRDDDPAEYSSRMIELQKYRDGLQRQFHELQTEYRDAISKAQEKALEENAKRIPELIPEWTNAELASKEKASLANYLSGSFSTEEINSISDARFVAMARKAMLFDQLQDKSKEVKQKIKTLPKRLSGGSPKGADQAKSEALKKLQVQHHKRGSIDSALALYKARRGS